jgi:tetratricopeptide (TPR) repeat protein
MIFKMTKLTTFLASLIMAYSVTSMGAVAQTPTVQVMIDSEEIFIGESFVLQAVVEGVDSSEQPDMNPLEEDFTVQFENEQSMNSTSVVIVNGRMTRQENLKKVYQYRVTPKRAGDLTVPPINVRLDGKIISSRPKQIRVLEPEPQEYVIIEVSSDRDRVYPTQTFQVNLKILVRELPNSDQDPLFPIRRNPPSLYVPWIEKVEGLRLQEEPSRWLQNLLSDQGYGFSINDYSSRSGFLFDGPRVALFDLVRGKETRKLENGEKARFFRYEITQTFAAIRPGKYTFGPAVVRGTFVVDSVGREYRGRKIAASTKPLEVVVSEVPSPRPIGFIGGIGKFSASLDISPANARIGDPMTLTLDITGQTAESLEQVFAPDLSQFEVIAKDFEVMDRSPVGKLERNHKIFTYGIRPKSKLDAFPELEFSSFDPVTESFVEFKSSAIPLKIEQGSALSISELTGARSSKSTVKQDRSGIFQGTREIYPFSNDSISIPVWSGVAGASWLIAFAGAGLLRWNRRRAKDSSAERMQRSKGKSLASIQNAKNALRDGKVDESLAAIRQSLVGLVGAMRGNEGQDLTALDMIESLRNTSLSEADLAKVKEIFDAIDSFRYGGMSNSDVAVMIEQASTLIQPIHTALLKNSPRLASRSNHVMLIGIFAFAPFSANSSVDSELDLAQEFEQAVTLLEQAKDKSELVTAARRLEDLERAGLQSGSLHVHCGNAWYQAGEYGNAIRHYRLAKFYLPRDSYVRSNLEQALRAAPGRLDGQRESDILENVFVWSRVLSHRAKVQLGTIILVAGACFFLLYSWRSQIRFIAASGICVLLAAGLLGEATLRSPERFAASYGVLNSQAMVRKGMGDEYSPAFDRPLLDGAEFEVLQRTPNWTLGRFPGIGDGWVKNEHIAGAGH